MKVILTVSILFLSLFTHAQYSWKIVSCQKISGWGDNDWHPENYSGISVKPHEKGGCYLTYEISNQNNPWYPALTSDYSTYDANLLPPNYIRGGCWMEAMQQQSKRSVVTYYESYQKKWKRESHRKMEISEVQGNKYKLKNVAYSENIPGPNNYEYNYECDLVAQF